MVHMTPEKLLLNYQVKILLNEVNLLISYIKSFVNLFIFLFIRLL
jgi:hypothetical protein